MGGTASGEGAGTTRRQVAHPMGGGMEECRSLAFVELGSGPM